MRALAADVWEAPDSGTEAKLAKAVLELLEENKRLRATLEKARAGFKRWSDDEGVREAVEMLGIVEAALRGEGAPEA